MFVAGLHGVASEPGNKIPHVNVTLFDIAPCLLQTRHIINTKMCVG